MAVPGVRAVRLGAAQHGGIKSVRVVLDDGRCMLVGLLYGSHALVIARGNMHVSPALDAAIAGAAATLKLTVLDTPARDSELPHPLWLAAERAMAAASGLTREHAEAELAIKSATGQDVPLGVALLVPGALVAIPKDGWFARGTAPDALAALFDLVMQDQARTAPRAFPRVGRLLHY